MSPRRVEKPRFGFPDTELFSLQLTRPSEIGWPSPRKTRRRVQPIPAPGRLGRCFENPCRSIPSCDTEKSGEHDHDRCSRSPGPLTARSLSRLPRLQPPAEVDRHRATSALANLRAPASPDATSTVSVTGSRMRCVTTQHQPVSNNTMGAIK